jgi:hypothetical protein
MFVWSVLQFMYVAVHLSHDPAISAALQFRWDAALSWCRCDELGSSGASKIAEPPVRECLFCIRLLDSRVSLLDYCLQSLRKRPFCETARRDLQLSGWQLVAEYKILYSLHKISNEVRDTLVPAFFFFMHFIRFYFPSLSPSFLLSSTLSPFYLLPLPLPSLSPPVYVFLYFSFSLNCIHQFSNSLFIYVFIFLFLWFCFLFTTSVAFLLLFVVLYIFLPPLNPFLFTSTDIYLRPSSPVFPPFLVSFCFCMFPHFVWRWVSLTHHPLSPVPRHCVMTSHSKWSLFWD